MGETNYSYFPLIFSTEKQLLRVESELNKSQIFPRRYFYPAANTLNHIVDYEPMPIAEDISKRILCLPLYWKLENNIVQRVIGYYKKHITIMIIAGAKSHATEVIELLFKK